MGNVMNKLLSMINMGQSAEDVDEVEDIDTIDYFVVTISLKSGKIVSVLSNETGLTMKYVIENEFDNIACNAPCIEGGMHVNIHWPESDEQKEE